MADRSMYPLLFPSAPTHADWCYRAGGDGDFRGAGTLAQACAEAIEAGEDEKFVEIGIAVPELVHAPDAADLMCQSRDDLGSREFSDKEIADLIRQAIEEQLASDCTLDDSLVVCGWADENITAEEIAPAVAAVKAVTDWEDEAQLEAVDKALAALVSGKTAPWYAVDPTWELTRADAALIAHCPKQNEIEREIQGRVDCDWKFSKWLPNPYESACNSDAEPFSQEVAHG